jgi:hypothetical protein
MYLQSQAWSKLCHYYSCFYVFIFLQNQLLWQYRAAQFYVLALGAESANYSSDCQTMLGMSLKKPLKFTRYSVHVRARTCVCEGETEVLQHPCSLATCTFLELIHKFTRLSEYITTSQKLELLNQTPGWTGSWHYCHTPVQKKSQHRYLCITGVKVT